MKKIYTLILLSFFFSYLVGQNFVTDSLETEFANAQTTEQKAALLRALFSEHQYNNIDKAIEYAEKALTLKGLSKNNTIIFKNKLVSSYRTIGKIEMAQQASQELLKLIENVDVNPEMIETYHNLGGISTEMNQPAQAIAHYLKALELAENFKDTLKLVITRVRIANLYQGMFEYGNARKYILPAVALAEATNDPVQKAYAYFVMGGLSDYEDPNDQLYYIDKTIEISEQLKNNAFLAPAYQNKVIFHYNRQEYDEAIVYGKKSLGLALEVKDAFNIIVASNGLAQSFDLSGQTDSMKQYTDIAIEYSKKLGNRYGLYQGYLSYSIYLWRKGQSELAYEYQYKALLEKDTIYNEQLDQSLRDADAKFENEKNRAELADQQLKISQQQVFTNRLIAIGAILLLVFLMVVQGLVISNRRRKKQAALEIEMNAKEAQRLKELDQLKSNFFANISHEFRTPLTLIISPLKELVNGTFKGNLETYHQIMLRNGERLLRLINQLLDLSKLEANKMELKLEEKELTSYIKQLAGTFTSYAFSKQIDLTIEVPSQLLMAKIDPDKFEKVINNLISNALKFTPDEGNVSVKLRQDNKQAIIEVYDTGIGISEKDLPYVFDRFYQVDADQDRSFEGSGIGLALAKELVELHGGTISVNSTFDEGSVFKTSWPLIENSQLATTQETVQLSSALKDNPSVPSIDASKGGGKTNKILVVEDNADVRFYITDKLKDQFDILEAPNGKIGLKIATDQVPDLIISDVMMPEMDGNELSMQLRKQSETSHIPIIMLTAKSDMDSKLEGLKTGVDDYLTKPIDSRELLIRIDNLLEQRKQLRSKYAKELVLNTKQDSEVVKDPEDQFMAKVMQIIGDHIENESFGVEDLAKAMLLSRYQLLRKIKALTGKSVSVFIRWVRLNKAKELLEQKQGNVSEIAFRLGFNSIAYFSKCFKEEFGISPSQIS